MAILLVIKILAKNLREQVQNLFKNSLENCTIKAIIAFVILFASVPVILLLAFYFNDNRH